MQGNDTIIDPFQEKTRPTGIILLSAALIVFSFFQILKFYQVIFHWEILSSLDLSISPLFQAGEGLFWALCGLFLTWGLWKRKPWVSVAIIIACFLFILITWIKQVFFFEPIVLQTRWPVNLVLTIIGLGLLAGLLNLKSTRSYLGKNTVKIP